MQMERGFDAPVSSRPFRHISTIPLRHYPVRLHMSLDRADNTPWDFRQVPRSLGDSLRSKLE
jgi:hypothetical protein